MAEVSVHRAMCSLKTITKRFKRGIDNLNVVGFTKGTSPRVLGSSGEIIAADAAALETAAKANYDSAVALINNFHATRCAIVRSNAGLTGGETLNTVIVDGVKLTVAEVIELKRAVMMLEELKTELATRWSRLSMIVTKIETDNERRLDAQLTPMKDATEADKAMITSTFNLMNSVKIVDPLNVGKLIDKLEDTIFKFNENVDVVLSESNASTKITIDENAKAFNLM